MRLLLSCLLSVVLAQASAVCPENIHGICRTDFRYRSPHDWIQYSNATSGDGVKWRVVLDQYDYQNIFGSGSIPPGVWESVDVDGDSNQWIHGGGGTCTHQIRVNSYRNPNTNNWFFTHKVSYCDAVELIVNATVRFSSCTQRPDCTNDFVIMHRFDTNSSDETERVKPDNYAYCFENQTYSRLQQAKANDDTVIVKSFLRPQTSYTYFGVQDIGTTGQVKRLLVYYKVCQKDGSGSLVKYPEIPLPPAYSNQSTVRLAECVEHAHNVTSLETYAYSNSDKCKQNVTCECDTGYEISQDSSSCIACEKGMYRSDLNTTCVPCPLNSMTDKEAADHCECMEGFFRTDDEGVGVACTAPPGPIPNELRIVTLCDTAVVLEWNRPGDVGRDDFYYDISRSVPDSEEIIIIEPLFIDVSDVVTYTVTGLKQKTAYTFSVCVHNGVSEHDEANARLRIVSKQGTTKQGSVFMHNNVALSNNSVVLREDIGEGEKALCCQTLSDSQCDSTLFPEMFFPNKSQVLRQSSGHTMYSTYGSGLVCLNRNEVDQSPLGIYFCQIPDRKLQGKVHNLFVKVGTLKTPNQSCPKISTCPLLDNPDHGTVSLNGNSSGSTATYHCDDNYELEGESTRTCGSDGLWSNQAPTCKLLSTNMPSIPPPIVSPSVNTCSVLEQPKNGRVTQFGNTPGNLAVYLCKSGFEIEGGMDNTRTCGDDGKWTGEAPTCIVHCPLLDHPDRGIVTISGDRTPDSVATYSCDGGLSLTGSPTRECQKDGIWSNEEPTCGNIRFELNGEIYSNGSSILMSSIGEGDDALQCITDGECCTPPNRAGEFLYPNGTTVKIVGSGDNLYRNREVGMIRLNRRNDASSPNGTYTCQIPDSNKELQTIFITLK